MIDRGSIVLSYARQDRALARRLHRLLSVRGFEVWVDWENVGNHLAWLPQVLGAIEAAGSVALVLSAHALRSRNCRLELDHARRYRKPVLCFDAADLSARGSRTLGRVAAGCPLLRPATPSDRQLDVLVLQARPR